MCTGEIAALTDRMVADCRVESASIFFVDRSAENSRVSYLYHTGVSAEAQHCYAARRVFRSDPFVALVGAQSDEFVRWGDDRVVSDSPDSIAYRGFLAQHDLAVVGALRRSITPTLDLVIGVHRLLGTDWRDEVPLTQLSASTAQLSDRVVEHLLGAMLDQSAGRIALQMVLPEPGDDRRNVTLSSREAEIAGLICAGKQNKHVAHALDISPFTVENHLRRIYRKLGIHTRAALVAHFTGRLH